MSRDTSRERSAGRSPTPLFEEPQIILNLNSSPGSSRKSGEDDGINIPNFSKELSLESTEDENCANSDRYPTQNISSVVNPESLKLTVEKKISVSPKSILKRKHPGHGNRSIGEDSPRNSKCCHPFVEKIKHIADKTLHRTDKSPVRKNVTIKKGFPEENQEIIKLESSPGSERRQKVLSQIQIKSNDHSDDTSNKQNKNNSKKYHVYEEISSENEEDIKDKKISFTPETIEELLKTSENIDPNEPLEMEVDSIKEQDIRATSETKSGASQDPSLQIDDDVYLGDNDHVMYLMKSEKIIEAQREALVLEASDESTDENFKAGTYPNVTITDVTEENDSSDNNIIIRDITDEPEDSDKTSEIGHHIVNIGEIGIQIEDDIETHSKTKNDWSKPGDHEYEPVGKPQVLLNRSKSELAEENEKHEDDLSSTTSQDRKYLRGIIDEQGNTHHESEDFSTIEENNIHLARSVQREIEDRYFVNTPTTTESRTECEISTSQVDSSALEKLPLKRASRNKFTSNNLENTKQKFRNQTTKLRSQADKLRTKIKNIKRPQFNMPEKPRFDKAKLSITQSIQRTTLQIPEKTKLKFKDLSEKFPDRPKFSLPERPKFSLPSKPKFKFPEKAKINFSSLKVQKEFRPKEDRNTSIESETDSKKKIIDFDFRKYPRLFTKSRKEKEPLKISKPLPRADTPTPPEFATVPRLKNKKNFSQNSTWDDSNQFNVEEPRQYGKFSLRNVHHINNNNYDYERPVNVEYDSDPPLTTTFQDHGIRQYTLTQTVKPRSWEVDKVENAETIVICDNDSSSRKSSTHNMSHSEYIDNQTAPHRTGVLEEINKDEFFLRQKGISEENIEVGKYLSQEIRDAFRLPVNALSQMDDPKIEVDDFMDSDLYIKDSNDKSYAESIDEQDTDDHRIMEENDDGYYTFPPIRPKRIKKLKKNLEKSLDFIDNKSSDNEEILCGDELPPRLNTNVSLVENNRTGFFQDGLQKLNEYENETDQTKERPIAPKRNKKILKDQSFSEQGSALDIFVKDEWIESIHAGDDDIIVHRIEHQYVIPEPEMFTSEPPDVPIRKRSRSRGSRGSCATSIPDDDRTSRGAESLILDTHPPAVSSVSVSERDLYVASRKSPNYATVEKLPRKRKDLPPRPPAPMKRQRSSKSLGGSRQFFTVPGHRRDSTPPKRPHRNYSTLGPSRPPRKKSATSLITLDNIRRVESNNFTQYVEIDDDSSDLHRVLKSGDVVNKMKDRPLPPPPIPKRGNKKSKDIDGKYDAKEKSDHENTTLTSSTSLITEQKLTTDKVYETEEIVEIEVSTQTDPLPDDFNFELSDDEPLEDQKIIIPRTVYGQQNDNAIKKERFIADEGESSAKSIQADSITENRPKSSSGRISPTAILVERRISSPTRINEEDQVVTTASLTVQPIAESISKKDFELEIKPKPKVDKPLFLTSTEKSRSFQQIEIPDNASSIENLSEKQVIQTQPQLLTAIDTLKTQNLQVSNLDVANLNVTEIQAHKILVSEIQGLSLRTTDLTANSSNVVVSGIELAPGVIDEIVNKFTQLLSETSTNFSSSVPQHRETAEVSINNTVNTFCEGETQTECDIVDQSYSKGIPPNPLSSNEGNHASTEKQTHEEYPPQRPPPPPFYPYLQEFSIPSSSFYRLHSPAMERPFTEFYSGENLPGPPKRRKPRPTVPDSSSDEDFQPPLRKPPHRSTEPTVTELGGQLVRACQKSISRTMRGMLNYITDHLTGRDGKKDVQMALVIFLVLIAGLIMLGVGDSRTVHHHHWEFFNPPTDPNV